MLSLSSAIVVLPISGQKCKENLIVGYCRLETSGNTGGYECHV